MKIYTSYFANKINNNIKKLPIVLYPPKWWTGENYSVLAPKPQMLKMNEKDYIYNYNLILNKLNPETVYNYLKNFALKMETDEIALTCYEKPDEFCHRHLAADWLNKALNLNIVEYNNKNILELF